MCSKYFLWSILVLTSILSSCSCLTPKSDDALSKQVNFSERIILASLGNKTQAGAFSEKDKPVSESSCIFDAGDHPSMDLSYAKFKATLKEGADKSAPLTEAQIMEAFNLLKTGQVKSDTQKTILELLIRIPGFPGQLLTDIPNMFRNPLDFPHLPGVHTAGETAKIFIKPDNRTFRLAILAYARMNGVNITEQNLDDLYNYLVTGREAEFDKLVEGGLGTLKDQYGATDIEKAAQKLHAIGQTCMSKANSSVS